MPFRDYNLVETRALLGYEISEKDEKNTTISGTPLYTQTFENTPIIRDITLIKVDKDDTDTKLEGVTFGLFKDSDFSEKVAEMTTDNEDKIIFTNAVYEKYQIKELSTKTGYALNTTPIDVNVDKMTIQ